MYCWFLSVHMLWGLFMFCSGNATFFETCHVVALTAVAVPGLYLLAVISNCVSTHTSPTPGVAGLCVFFRVLGSWKYACIVALRSATWNLDPLSVWSMK